MHVSNILLTVWSRGRPRKVNISPTSKSGLWMAKLVRQWVKFSLRYNLNEQNINKQISTARYLKQLLLSQSSLLFPRDTTSLYAVNNSRKKNSLVTHEQKSVLCPGGAGGGGGADSHLHLKLVATYHHLLIVRSSEKRKARALYNRAFSSKG